MHNDCLSSEYGNVIKSCPSNTKLQKTLTQHYLKMIDYKDLKFVKVGFKEDGMTEYMWVMVKSIDNDIVTGFLDNDPVLVKYLKCGDLVEFNKDEIIWLFEG